MNAVADTGALYALYDKGDRQHRKVRAALAQTRGLIFVPAAILGEIDYLLRASLGVDAELAFLASLANGAFQLEGITEADLDRCQDLIKIYRGLDLGLADASVIATAERLGVDTILTLDERDFRAVKSRVGPLRLLPADL